MEKSRSFNAIIAAFMAVIMLLVLFPFTAFAHRQDEASDSEAALLAFAGKYSELSEANDGEYFEDRTLDAGEVSELAAIIEAEGADITTALELLDEAPGKSSESKYPDASGNEKRKALRILAEAAEAGGFEVGENSGDTVTLSSPYQTKRIIVCASKEPEDFGATDVIGSYNGLYVLQYATETEAKEAHKKLAALPYVEFAQADGIVSADEEHLSWGYGENYLNVDPYNLWLTSMGKELPEVKVAVIDTGVMYDHEYLSGRVDTENDYDFVNNDNNAYDDDHHGTHVAGTVVDGTPDNVVILPVKVLDAEGHGTDMQVYNGVEWAIKQGVDVINMSLGGEGSSATDAKAVNDATNAGIIVCVSAGNESDDANGYSPANVKNAITVAAIDKNYNLADFSNYGSCVDIAAPGRSIYSSYYDSSDPNNKSVYATLSGTSMACPHVAAACACLKSYDKSITASAAMALFKNTAKKVNTSFGVGVGALCMTDIITDSTSKLLLMTGDLTMYPGQSLPLEAVTMPEANVSWSSSDTSVAKITYPEGKPMLYAVASGSCVIKASANGEERSLTVTVSPLSFKLATETLNVYMGVDTPLKYTLSHDVDVEFTSDNNAVLHVSDNGIIYPYSEGTATVTATAGNITKTCTVTVKGVDYDSAKTQYVIKNADDLYEIAVLAYVYDVSFLGKSIRIDDSVTEIDLSSYPEWLPIGEGIYYFEGSFDGNNKPIKNLTIDDPDRECCGLFSWTGDAVIKNVILDNVYINGSETSAGLAAIAHGSKIYGSSVSGRIISHGEEIGGIVAELAEGGSVYNCVNYADVSTDDLYAGGIVGMVFDAGSTIENCINFGSVSSDICGGIAATVQLESHSVSYGTDAVADAASSNPAVINCVNVGQVKHGVLHTTYQALLKNCYWLSTASNDAYSYLPARPQRGMDSSSAFKAFNGSYKLSDGSSLLDKLNTAVYENNSGSGYRYSYWELDEDGKLAFSECAHANADYAYIVEPTCTVPGSRSLRCPDCRKDLVTPETVPALGHSTVLVGAKSATCTEEGYSGDRICTRCHETVQHGSVTKALGHNFVFGTCTHCGATNSSGGGSGILSIFSNFFNSFISFFTRLFSIFRF